MKRAGIGARPRSGLGTRRSRRPSASPASGGSAFASSCGLADRRGGARTRSRGPATAAAGRHSGGFPNTGAAEPGSGAQAGPRRGPNRPLRLRGRAATPYGGREAQDNERTFANVCGQPLRRGLEALRSRPFRPQAARASRRGRRRGAAGPSHRREGRMERVRAAVDAMRPGRRFPPDGRGPAAAGQAASRTSSGTGKGPMAEPFMIASIMPGSM